METNSLKAAEDTTNHLSAAINSMILLKKHHGDPYLQGYVSIIMEMGLLSIDLLDKLKGMIREE